MINVGLSFNLVLMNSEVQPCGLLHGGEGGGDAGLELTKFRELVRWRRLTTDLGETVQYSRLL